MKLSAAARWALLPLASIGACTGAWVLTGAVRGGAARIVSPEQGRAILTAVPVEVCAGVGYAAAAIAFVVAGALVAPRFRLAVAVLMYGAGALIAWRALGGWWIPEGHPRAYQPSQVPLTLTLAGGLVGVAAVVFVNVVAARRLAAARSRPAG